MTKLINQPQPFGHVENHVTMPGQGRPAEHRNAMASKTEVPNRGKNTVHSFADKNPGAYSQACKHRDNPFFWTGKPK